MSEYKDKLIELKEDLRELMLKAPELAKFGEFVKIAESTNVLDEKTKELITVGIAVALRCEPCIMWHIDAALNAGATSEEILETIKVAVAMGGGPALMYGIKAYEILKEYSKR